MARLSIRLLGSFRVDLEGMPVDDFKSDKVRALLAFLVVEGDRPHSRDSLACLLWPDSPNQVARTNLRSILANLRKVIHDRHTSPPHLLINRETIQFNKASDHWLDVDEIMSMPFKSEIDPTYLGLFERAIQLYEGPFLSGFSLGDSAPFDEWEVMKREQINRRIVVALSNLAAYYEQQGEYEIAQTHAWKLVELESWNEEAHRQLMRLLALGGRRSAALAQYESCCTTLIRELDVEPSWETTALYEAIRDENLANYLSIISPTPITDKQVGRPLFVGRQAELAQLDDRLEGALTGGGQVVFVTGSPGSGKTALISEFIDRAMRTHTRLIPVLGGCNVYTGISDPYLPFLEIMGLLTGDMRVIPSGLPISPRFTRRLLALLPAAVQALVEVGPDLINRMVPGASLVERVLAASRGRGDWLEKLQGLIENQSSTMEGENIQQINLFDQYTRVLHTLASLHPLILVIDDLQWADTGSISLFYHLARRIRGSRIMLVGAFRQEDVDLGRDGVRHPLEPIVSELQGDYGEVQINLDQSDGRGFVKALLDSEPNRLSPSFRDLLFSHTVGHPLFTIELLRSLQERGELVQDEHGCWTEGKTFSWDKLPTKVEAVISERVGRLPPDLYRALEVASVEGEEFTAEVVARVAAVDEGYLVQQLSEQLDRKHHLVAAGHPRRLNGQRISPYQFRHQLFQTYLYESLDDVERTYYHEQVGGTLESFYQGHPEEMKENLFKLARHFQEAEMPQKAINYLRLSGEEAERLSASEEAIAQFRNALELCMKMKQTPKRDQIEMGLIMALGAQLIATRGYSSVEVEQIYTRADQLCREMIENQDDTSWIVSQIFPALLGLGAFYGHQARYQAAGEIYDQFFTLARSSRDPEAMLIAKWSSAYLLVHTGDFPSARSQLEEVFEGYEPHKHQRLITVFTLDMGVSCLSWLSWALFFLGFPDQAFQRSREAIALARQISHPFSLAVALSVATLLHAYAHDADRTRELAEEAIDICHQKGFTFWFGVASTLRGLVLAWQGEYEQGISLMREGEYIWRASGAVIGLPEHLILLAEVMGYAGRVEDGLKALDEALEMISQSGETIYLAELHRTRGELLLKHPNPNPAEAEACFREAIEIARMQKAKTLELRATTSLSSLLSEQGRRDEASTILVNIVQRFTEGFQTHDYESASDLLRKLS